MVNIYFVQIAISLKLIGLLINNKLSISGRIN